MDNGMGAQAGSGGAAQETAWLEELWRQPTGPDVDGKPPVPPQPAFSGNDPSGLADCEQQESREPATVSAADVAGQGRIVLVWGPHGAPGRSTVAASLAHGLAGFGGAILVDADVEAPSLVQILGMPEDSSALAGAAPGATVLATDVNERSLALTARNAAAAGLDNVRTSQAEALLAELGQTSTPVDLIWSNPPVRIGKDALHELLLSWLALLSADGEAWLVVLKNLGADSLATWLTGQGWDVSRQASSKGFRVLRVRRGPDGPVDG